MCPRQRGEPGVSGRVAYREQKFECGDFLEVNIYPVFQSTVQSRRRAKRNPTREVQQVLNRLNAAKEVNRVICANFTNQDYYITLTYKGDPPDLERAKRRGKFSQKARTHDEAKRARQAEVDQDD